MTKSEFFDIVADILDEPSGSFDGSEVLAELESWDSLARLSFIAVVDKRLGHTFAASKLNECGSINDLARLAGI